MSCPLRKLSENRLLASLPPDDVAYLASFTRIEAPRQGRVLISASRPNDEVWFPHGGVIGLITTDAGGRTVQTGMIGRHGCVGWEVLFGEGRAVSDAVVQLAGAMSVIPATELRIAFGARPHVQAALSQFLNRLSARSLQTIACNRLHKRVARCCRWLLTIQDKANCDDVPLTQENLATLLGSDRPRVNVLLAGLEKEGILRRSRGRIHLLSRAGLERQTCECYYITRDL